MFESHVTVTSESSETFKNTCKELGVKAILIEQDTGSNNVDQLMTAKFHTTDQYDVAFQEMEKIASRFKNPIRRKLERIISKYEQPENFLYLEFHSKYELRYDQVETFLSLVRDAKAHSSTNTFQRNDGIFYFVTARDEKKYQQLRFALRQYKLVSTIRECVMFDSNPDLDIGWHQCQDCQMKKHWQPTVYSLE